MERKTGVRSKPGARSKQPRDGWARGWARVDGLGAARVWNSYSIPSVLNSGVLYIYIYKHNHTWAYNVNALL